jgi:hypothetical protein
MKKISFLLAGVLVLALSGVVQGGTVTYTFDTNPPPDWVNKSGNWIANGGVYYPQNPGNIPPTYAYLPFSLTDCVVEVDINNATDGGIWIHSSFNSNAGWANGILLVTKPGLIYWHEVVNNSYGSSLAIGSMPAGNVHVKVVASGTTYEAYVNNVLATTLTTSAFPSGFVGLYDYATQTFDNFQVTSDEIKCALIPGVLLLLD